MASHSLKRSPRASQVVKLGVTPSSGASGGGNGLYGLFRALKKAGGDAGRDGVSNARMLSGKAISLDSSWQWWHRKTRRLRSRTDPVLGSRVLVLVTTRFHRCGLSVRLDCRRLCFFYVGDLTAGGVATGYVRVRALRTTLKLELCARK